MDIYIKWISVLRDTARAPLPPTRQPNGHFWAKRSYYLGREQKFWYSHIRKPPWNLVRIVFFGQTWHQLDQKGQYLAKNDQKCIFWAKFCRFWAKILFFFGEGAKVLVFTYQKANQAPCPHCFLVGHSTNIGQKGKYSAQNDQKCQVKALELIGNFSNLCVSRLPFSEPSWENLSLSSSPNWLFM